MFNLSLDDTWAFLQGIAPDSIEAFLRSWLQEHGIYDAGLTLRHMQERFARFYGTTFGVAPPECWPRMRRDLLEVESALACRQTDIGLVSAYPFRVRLRENVRLMSKATSLIPEERAWVKQYIAGMVETGVMELVPTAQCACNIVLVKEG